MITPHLVGTFPVGGFVGGFVGGSVGGFVGGSGVGWGPGTLIHTGGSTAGMHFSIVCVWQTTVLETSVTTGEPTRLTGQSIDMSS